MAKTFGLQQGGGGGGGGGGVEGNGNDESILISEFQIFAGIVCHNCMPA